MERKQLYQLSLSVSYRSFILHQGPETLSGLSALARTYGTQRTRGVSEIGDNGNNCTSNLAPCLSQVCNQIRHTMQREHNGRVIRELLFFKLISL